MYLVELVVEIKQPCPRHGKHVIGLGWSVKDDATYFPSSEASHFKRYSMLFCEKEQEEERLDDDTAAMEAAAIPEDALGEIIGPTHATDEQLNQMCSMYVKDENRVLHHK